MYQASGTIHTSSTTGTLSVLHKGYSVAIPSTVGTSLGNFWGFAEAFLLECRPATSAAYRRDLTCFGAWCQVHGVLPLASRRVDVATYLQALRSRGYADGTVGRRLACLRSFFRYLVDEEVLGRSPAASVRWRQTRSVPRGALSAAELGLLLRAADQHSPRVAAAVWVLATTGARVSEVCLADASPEGLRRVEPSWLLRIVRKGGSEALVPLHPEAVDRLSEYLQDRMAGPLLTTTSGRAWDRRAVHRTLSGMGRSLRLQVPLGPHTLRHTLVTLARTHGCPLETIQDTVGHASTRTTRGYDHTDPTVLTQPAEYVLSALASRT